MATAATVASWSRSRLPSDSDIVRRVVAGELALFEVLMRRNNQRLYRVVRSVLQNEAEVEDVMQQAYVQAFGALAAFEHTARFSTWLIRIGLNAALASRRLAGRLSPPPGETAMPEELETETLPSVQPTPEDRASTGELRHLLERVMDGLPERYRTVLMLREVEGLTTAEVAQALAVSDDVIKTRLHRAKLMAREALGAMTDQHLTEMFQFHASRCDRVVAAVLATVATQPE